jgi:hypothetical protein
MNSRLGMHGRDEEIRWLNAALGTAQRGAGVLVGIEGAAGTGKSRLVQETCERGRARGALVLIVFPRNGSPCPPAGRAATGTLRRKVSRIKSLRRCSGHC